MLLKLIDSGATEGGGFVHQVCDTASLAELFRIFRKMVVASSSRVEMFKNVTELQFFETPGTAEPVTLS